MRDQSPSKRACAEDIDLKLDEDSSARTTTPLVAARRASRPEHIDAMKTVIPSEDHLGRVVETDKDVANIQLGMKSHGAKLKLGIGAIKQMADGQNSTAEKPAFS